MTISERTSDEQTRPLPRREGPRALLAANGDLLFAVAVCAAMGGALLAPAGPLLRLPLALIFAAILPGYMIDMALWPERDAQDFVERAALSVALSLGAVALVALALNVTPWGIRLGSLYPAICAVILAAAGVCFARRWMGGPSEQVDAAGSEPEPRIWQCWGALRTAGLAAAVVLVLAGTAVAAARRPQERLTEFFILDMQGGVANYPTQARAGEPITLPASVVNHEGGKAHYRVLVQAGGRQIGGTEEFALADGKTWSGNVSFTPQAAAQRQEVDLLLLKDGSAQPYRRLMLWLQVAPAPSARSAGA